MTNQSMIQQSAIMRTLEIVSVFMLFQTVCYGSNSTCLSCSSNLCYLCYNTFPLDRTNVEELTIICNETRNTLQQPERFYSIIQRYRTINCSMQTFYFDQYTLWNYLESMSIVYANLTYLSSIVFNRTLSLSSPILYSIKALNLSHNTIQMINKNFSYYFPSLEKLDLSYNHLRTIKKKTFSNLIHLRELYLNNNFLKRVFPTILSQPSLHVINLNMNSWYCTCRNILTLLVSRPIPTCTTPKEFQDQNISSVARQCYLRRKVNMLITVQNSHEETFNLTCTLSSIVDEWYNKINQNLTFLTAWHMEQHHFLSIDHFAKLPNRSNKYLVCFDLQSDNVESIHTIVHLPEIISPQSTSVSINQISATTENSTLATSPTETLSTSTKATLSPAFHWLLKISKTILPKYFQKSDTHVLIVWLILLVIAIIIFIALTYFIYYRRKNNNHPLENSRSCIRCDTDARNHRTLLNVKFTCRNHKCLCQYRRRAHSTLYLTKSASSSLYDQQSHIIQSLYTPPSQCRYAKIKQIPSTKKLDHSYLAGEFRTIVKLKSLPS